MQENGTDQPRVYRRTRSMLKIRCSDIRQTRHNYSQLTETEKAKFQTPFTYSDERNFVKRNSVKKISDDLVHPTKSHTSSVSFSIFSEERKKIAEDIPAPTDVPGGFLDGWVVGEEVCTLVLFCTPFLPLVCFGLLLFPLFCLWSYAAKFMEELELIWDRNLC